MTTKTPGDAATLDKDFAAVSDMFGTDINDPHSLYRQYRTIQPVMEGDILARFGVPSQADYSNLGRQVFTLFKYHDVLAVLRDSTTYSSTLLNEGLGKFFGGFLLTGMENGRHKQIRSLLAPAFSPRAVQEWKVMLGPVAQDAVAALRPAGRAELINDLLLPLPVRMIYEIMGFPHDTEQMNAFAARALKILVGPQRDPEKMRISMEAAFQAAQELYDETLHIVRQRRAAGSLGNNLIGYLLRADNKGDTLYDSEITELIRQFLPAAAETTTRSFGSMLVALLQDPALRERVTNDRALVSKVVSEGMRWETASQFLARQANIDVEIRGVKIPAGAALSLATGSGNRDEEIFENPDVFDIDREQRTNLGFGAGAHLCLGMQVARTEMEAMLNALLDLPKLRLDPSQPPPVIVGAQLRGPRTIHVIWN
jgi:cytochrome P450